MCLFVAFELLVVLLLVVVEIVLDLGYLPKISWGGRRGAVGTYLSQDGVPMGFGGEDGTVVVHLHYANRLGDVLDLALVAGVFLGYRLWADVVRVFDGAIATGEAGGNGCLGGGRSSTLGAIGHQRKNQSFKTVNAVLHVIWSGGGASAGCALLTVAWSCVRT